MTVQFFPNQQTPALAFTQGGGVVAVPYSQTLQVFANGQLLPPESYTVAAGVGVTTITVSDDIHVEGNYYIVVARTAPGAAQEAGLDCLQDLIGLSPVACPCFEAGQAPAGFNSSSSGYFVTDVEYGYPIREAVLANATCEAEGFWEGLAWARAQALRDLKHDLEATLAVEASRKGYAWAGVIGDVKANRAISAPRPKAGILIQPLERKLDDRMVITALYAGFQHTGTVEVTLTSNALDFAPLTFTLDTVAGRFVKTTLPNALALPLYDPALGSLTYSLHYETQGVQALDSKAYCGGCGNRPGWSRVVKIASWNRDEDPVADQKAYLLLPCNREMRGLALEASFECLRLDFLCRLPSLGEANTLSLLGRALQHKAAIKLMERDASSPKVNQFTLLNAETRAAKTRAYRENYQSILTYVARNVPNGASSCWGCPKGMPRVAAISV
jgi:hypothetical protein